MPAVPPGIRYLSSLLLPALGTPSIAIAFARALLARYYEIALPAWAVAPLVGLWIVVSALIRLTAAHCKLKKECAELGAIAVPKVIPQWPGGVNAVNILRENAKSGYMGAGLRSSAIRCLTPVLCRRLFRQENEDSWKYDCFNIVLPRSRMSQNKLMNGSTET